MDVAGVSLGDSTMEQGDSLSHQPSLPGPADISGASLNLGDHPFRRWMRGIRRGRATHMVATQPYVHGWPEGNDIDAIYGQELTAFPRIPESQTERSSVASSLLLKTVKTASMSMASLSVFNRPRTNTQASTQRSVCHSSGFSGSDARVSVDSNRLTSTLSLDEGAWKRAVHRRQAIREILNTEITYVAGLKALSDVLSTFVVTRTALHRSTLDILRLHEQFLAELRSVVPVSDAIADRRVSGFVSGVRHTKWSGLDTRLRDANSKSVLTRNLLESIDSRIKSSKPIAAEPAEAADVAQILRKMLPRFIVYEEYGVKYQLASEDIELLRKSVSCWQMFDQGIEALSKSLASLDSREANANHCYTLSDLLMKPIQRVCKYKLFLTELLKCTPVADCPTSHAIIESTLHHVLEVSAEINRVIGDPTSKDRIQKSLLLGDKLDFSKQRGHWDVFRDFGSVKVCGVLHVAYQTSESVAGDYMMCALFAQYLVLATAPEDNRQFKVVASILITDLMVDAVDNGIGLHCDGVPHSWKIIFEASNHTFELVLTACSEKEELPWKNHLLKQSQTEPSCPPGNRRAREFSVTSLALKPLSAVIVAGQLHRLVRRSSIHGSLAPTPNTEGVRLLIKGTQALCHGNHPEIFYLGRSQSVQNRGQTAILAPKRQDRIRMERNLSDVWTSDILPYPGMVAGRGEHLIRTSAGSFIRRLSSRSPFTRRSSSLATTATTKSTDVIVNREDEAWNEKASFEDLVASQTLAGYGDLDYEKFAPCSSPQPNGPNPISRLRRQAGKKDADLSLRKSSGAPSDGKLCVKKKWRPALFKTTSPPKHCYSCQAQN